MNVIKIVVWDSSFQDPAMRSTLLKHTSNYLGPAFGVEFVIQFTENIGTKDLLFLEADALIVNPDGHEELWPVLQDALEIGLFVVVRSATERNLERARGFGIKTLDARESLLSFVTVLGNMFRYFEDRIET